MHLCGSKCKSYTRVYSKNSHPACQRDALPRDAHHRHALNVCDPPKFTCGSPHPHVVVLKGVAFGRGLGHVGGALMKGMRTLTKGTPQSSLAPSLTEKELRQCFALGRPAARTVSDTFLLFISCAAARGDQDKHDGFLLCLSRASLLIYMQLHLFKRKQKRIRHYVLPGAFKLNDTP